MRQTRETGPAGASPLSAPQSPTLPLRCPHRRQPPKRHSTHPLLRCAAFGRPFRLICGLPTLTPHIAAANECGAADAAAAPLLPQGVPARLAAHSCRWPRNGRYPPSAQSAELGSLPSRILSAAAPTFLSRRPPPTHTSAAVEGCTPLLMRVSHERGLPATGGTNKPFLTHLRPTGAAPLRVLRLRTHLARFFFARPFRRRVPWHAVHSQRTRTLMHPA